MRTFDKSSSDGAGDAVPKSSIDKAMIELAERVERMRDSVITLVDRLEPVLRTLPEKAGDTEDKGAVFDTNGSDVKRALQAIAFTVEGIQFRVDELFKRLEV